MAAMGRADRARDSLAFQTPGPTGCDRREIAQAMADRIAARYVPTDRVLGWLPIDTDASSGWTRPESLAGLRASVLIDRG